MDSVETQVMSKVTKRLLPFLIVCYFIAYLDRVNVSFAALTMNKDLAFTATIFGWGSGIFFIGYFIFEVPSNIALERFGARLWIFRIMLSWGILSAGMALIWDSTSFYVMRFLLGVAEAGFFPGIILFLTYWFPAAYRARIVGYFMAAIPVSSIIGAPLSSFILGLDGVLGLKGWQWLFILEAIPAVLMSFAVLAYLTDGPTKAHWLSAEEREWLSARLNDERQSRESIVKFTLSQALAHPRVLFLSLVYFGIVATNYGLSFWLPQIIKGFGGLTNLQTGFITAVPYVAGAIAMVFWGLRSDREQERKWHVAIPIAVSATGLALSAMTDDPVLKMSALTLAGLGIFGVLPCFWTLPTALLTGTAAAGGIALINSVGNIAGFVGPFAMGKIKDMTGAFTFGLLFIAALAVISFVIVLALGHNPALEGHAADSAAD
ncbi:MAG TPA: MFS transporter [Alphaproteobacteria bacterium]|nr:MFS transporter [Alphaproteobacteria bacterium]